MPQVTYDKAILFEDEIHSVTQTWNEQTLDLRIDPENPRLRERIESILASKGQMTLNWKGNYFELVD